MSSKTKNPAITKCRLCGAPATVAVLYFSVPDVRACNSCSQLPLTEWVYRMDTLEL
jgi:hypothetical protein